MTLLEILRRLAALAAQDDGLFADDFGPGQLADLLYLLVDLVLCRLLSENAAKVIDLR